MKLAANPKVGMVSLTGSVEAGIQTMAAASTNVTKVSLELGGKAPGIVMPDADLDLAVKSIMLRVLLIQDRYVIAVSACMYILV